MKFNLRTVAFAAAALVASAGAHAALDFATAASLGNSSVLFVAVDKNNDIALTVDLGLNMSAFTNATTFTSGLTSDVTWNFATNATNSGATGNSWDAAYSDFKAAQSGGDYQWAVVAADAIAGTNVTASNAISGRGWLSTGNATQQQMLLAQDSGPTGNGLGNFGLFIPDINNEGNLISANNGAATATTATGEGYLPTRMTDSFGGQQTWSFLMNNGVSSTFQWQQQLVANPLVHQFGAVMATDSLAANPITFTFDIATDTLVLAAAPIPEPGTYAMLLAGLSAVGFMVRRRKA